MAFDPHREDYQRMGLRFARALDGESPAQAARSFAAFGRRFAQNRDGLPQTDEDRAFHLVAKATTLIDYELPFTDDEHAERLIAQGHAMLDEALKLDPQSPDALRMKMAAGIPNFEGYYDYLASEAEGVRERCERRRHKARSIPGEERSALAAQIALYPYLRWLASLASRAVVCGHNHDAISHARRALELDPTDQADARFTAYLAFAKLEDAAGLEALARTTGRTAVRGATPADAWLAITRCALAYKRLQLDEADHQLDLLAKAYPHAAVTLCAQRELPDGVFARLAVAPFSEDELILAVSEATVLLQEGRDARARGAFGSWVMGRMEPRMTPAERTALELARSQHPNGDRYGTPNA